MGAVVEQAEERLRMSLPRRRMTALLSGSPSESVSLLVAPPGYGKTTALLDYASDQPKVVWISPPADSDLEGFVREIVLAIAPSSIRSLGTVLSKQTDESFHAELLRWLLGRFRTFRGTLIIDDLHRISGSPKCTQLLSDLVANTHERLRWILSSREMPALPVGTWIARGWMGLPITSDDLAFDDDEAAALAAMMGISVAASDISGIVAETQGWPIGVRLSIELTGRSTGRPIRIRTREILFNYVESEIWSRLDKTMRDIIFACAIVPKPNVDMLIMAGFEHAAELIDQLDATVPFIQKDTHGAFLLHDLFREYILDKARHAPTIIRELAQRIAVTFADKHLFAEALQLYVNTELIDGTLDVLARAGFDLISTGYRAEVVAALDFLQLRGYLDHPVSASIRASLEFADGSATNAEALFVSALRGEISPNFRFETARRFAVLQINRGNPRASLDILAPLLANSDLTISQRVELRSQCAASLAFAGRPDQAREAIATVESQLDQLVSEPRVRVLTRLGFASFYLGDLTKAESYSLDAATMASSIGMDSDAAGAFSVLYNVAYLSDEDDRRALFFNRSLGAAAEKAGNTAIRVRALRTEFLIYAERGDDAGMQNVDESLSRLTDARSLQDEFQFRFAKAVRDAGIGEYRRAISNLTKGADSALSGAERGLREAFIALLSLLDGDRDAALGAVGRTLLVDADQDFGSRRYVSLAFAFRGLVLWALDRKAQAQRSITTDENALGARDLILVNALRQIVALPRPLPNVEALDGAIAQLQKAGYGGYARVLLALGNREAAGVELSAAEIEILRAFNQFGGRTSDIALVLKKSPHTVQTQIKSAIRKIGCNGRGEALAYARKRGWLEASNTHF